MEGNCAARARACARRRALASTWKQNPGLRARLARWRRGRPARAGQLGMVTCGIGGGSGQIAKSPVAPPMRFAYQVTASGLHLLEGPEGEGVLLPPESVLGMTFGADFPYLLPGTEM